MTERRRGWRLAGLTLLVVAVHLWLLGGLPRIVAPARHASPFVARTVVPPPAAPQPASPAVAQAPATSPPARMEPLPPAPRKQDPRRSTPQASAAAARAASTAVQQAPAPAIAASPALADSSSPAATHASGASRASHVSVPPSARYHYDVVASAKGMTLRGTALLEWRNDGHAYEAQLSMSSPVPFVRPRTQRSTGLVTPAGLAPERFSDKTRSEEATHFDRGAGRIVFSTNKPEATLEPGVQDRLSIVMQLSALLAGEPSKYPSGTAITVQTASTKEAEPWTFVVEGRETLDLPGGRVAAVRLARAPRKEYDVKVELWLAPGAAYAPVRLRLTQPNGDWVDQLWSSTDRG